VEIVFVGNAVSSSAGVFALGGGRITLARGEGSLDVVVAWGERVRLAPFGNVLEITGNDTFSLVVLPGGSGVTTIASITAR
jgi:hypothetical protein